MTKAKQIREFANNNASATPQEIADACGVTRIYVYQVLHKMKNKKGGLDPRESDLDNLEPKNLCGYRNLSFASHFAVARFEHTKTAIRRFVARTSGRHQNWI